MSHMIPIKTQIRSKAGLLAALVELCPRWEGKIEVHDTPQTMWGYDGQVRPTKAEIVIRRNHIGAYSNDLGFTLAEDGSWTAIISDYDRGQFDPRWLKKLTNQVGMFETKRQYQQKLGKRVEFVTVGPGKTKAIVHMGY